MLQIKYDSWSKLPIGKYEKIKEIIREGVEDGDIEILAVLCDCPVDDILNSPISDVWALRDKAKFLSKSLNIKERLFFKSIKIDGVKYNIHTDFKDITTAQYIDFQTFYQDYEKNYCNVLATFIIPEGHKYNDGYDALETAEIFREKLSVEVAENACFFFASRSESSLKRELMSLILMTTKTAMKTKNLKVRSDLEKTVKQLVKQREDIAGLGKLMRSHIQKM